MAKFNFLPDLHHVHSKIAFFASYSQPKKDTPAYKISPM